MLKVASVALAMTLSGAFSGPVWGGAQPLFASHELLRLTLEAPLGEVIRDAVDDSPDGPEPSGILRVGSRAIPIQLSAFGNSRLRVCELPPLKLTVKPSAVADTVFEGEETLRLVTHCGADDGSDRFVLLEYLVYRMYGLLTEPALKVRLAEIEYRDTARGPRGRSALAFFVEDINRAAARHGLEWLTIERQALDDLVRSEVSLFALFQFMIGNTDWSVLRGPAGERCCHNVAVLGDSEGGSRDLLPFDFDSAGLVNAPYAVPAVQLGLLKVTQRHYRGFCSNTEFLPESVARFRALEPQIEDLLSDASLPHPRARAVARKYLGQFFKIISDPKKLDKKIRRRCRGGG